MHFQEPINLISGPVFYPATMQDSKAKLEALKKLTPAERKSLPPADIEFFYNNFPIQDIKINRAHYTKTLSCLPAFNQHSSTTKPEELLTLFNQVAAQNKEYVEELVAEEFEIKTVKAFHDGLEEFLNTIAMSKKKTAEAKALASLVSCIIDLLKILPPREALKHLQQMSVGGQNCDVGQFTQAYKVYLKLLKLDTLESYVLKPLHDFRDNILDIFSTQHGDLDETVEIKSGFLELYADDLGLISAHTNQNPINYDDPTVIHNLIETIKKQNIAPKKIESALEDLQERLSARPAFFTKFYSYYTPAAILDLLRPSKDLHRYYLTDSTDACKDYLFDHVISTGFLIKDEYILLMLDNLDVLSFT